jgi:predicted alpha-1,2-mannosidase
MNYRKIFVIVCGLVILNLGCSPEKELQLQPVDYVNPYMGNISHLLVPTYPTIHLPNSLLRVFPNRGDFTGDMLNGLPVVVTHHRRGSSFSLSPYQGKESDMLPVIWHSYDREKLTPYSYSVYLDEQHIGVDFGLSHQSAMYDFQFEKDEPAYLILNSRQGELTWDGEAIRGYQSLGNNTRVYIHLIPGEQPQRASALKEGKLTDTASAEGRNACLALQYPDDTKNLQVRYGISFIDADQAQKNMEREILEKSVAELQSEGRQIWNDELGKIEIEGGTKDERVVFYTSLYRCYERPVCISEEGRYFSAFDGQVNSDEGRPFYTDDWIWDTYRAHHPLRILLYPEMEEDIIHSFVLMAEQSENLWMPTFPGVSGDGHAMNSNHGVATVLDAHRKGLGDFDMEKAYQACKGAITEKTLAPWSGKPAGQLDKFYREHGYIPALEEGEEETIPEVHPFESRQSVAVTLGTSYDEWCLAQIAKDLGKTEDADYFMNNSYNYRNLFNPKTKFFHPKNSEGEFIRPFDYVFSGGQGARDYYDENNAWVYRWDVPHNIPDLVELMGGNEAFTKNMDAMFSEPLGKSKYDFYAQLPDHTGNVGQFSMANEPSLHIPYLYNYAAHPWKTQKRIRTLLRQWFRNDLMGVPGDEDGGGLSSFVVFSSMGFYPVTPGRPVYSIGSPMFEYMKIHLGNGNVFEVEARNASFENKYIQSATINGKPLDKPWFDHDALANGGKLVIEMGKKPNYEWGI